MDPRGPDPGGSRADDVIYFAAVLTGVVLGILILLLGGPPWASLGFGYLAFQVVRATSTNR